MEPNREFAELVGICWHDYGRTQYEDGAIEFLTCRKCKSVTPNPDFAADPRLVLREMRKRARWQDFAENVFKWRMYDVVDDILDTTGKLRDKAIEFMKEQEK